MENSRISTAVGSWARLERGTARAEREALLCKESEATRLIVLSGTSRVKAPTTGHASMLASSRPEACRRAEGPSMASACFKS